jgi:hypothetical protein
MEPAEDMLSALGSTALLLERSSTAEQSMR